MNGVHRCTKNLSVSSIHYASRDYRWFSWTDDSDWRDDSYGDLIDGYTSNYSIDEFRFYNTRLSSSDILTIKNYSNNINL